MPVDAIPSARHPFDINAFRARPLQQQPHPSWTYLHILHIVTTVFSAGYVGHAAYFIRDLPGIIARIEPPGGVATPPLKLAGDTER